MKPACVNCSISLPLIWGRSPVATDFFRFQAILLDSHPNFLFNACRPQNFFHLCFVVHPTDIFL